MASKKEKAEAMAFEEAMEKLESIVEGMESEKLPLEDLVTSYEQGTKLLKICQDRIADAQKRIEIIAKDAGADSGFALTEFDANESGAEAEAEAETEEGEESDEIRLL